VFFVTALGLCVLVCCVAASGLGVFVCVL
jgi:hypothetical protein